jgi:putative transposase
VIHHSDQGTQYTSVAFGLRCKLAGVRPSMGSVGDAYDNAMCESFFATLECELIDRESFHNQADARMVIFTFIEGWYNPHRRHSAWGRCHRSTTRSCTPLRLETKARNRPPRGGNSTRPPGVA